MQSEVKKIYKKKTEERFLKIINNKKKTQIQLVGRNNIKFKVSCCGEKGPFLDRSSGVYILVQKLHFSSPSFPNMTSPTPSATSHFLACIMHFLPLFSSLFCTYLPFYVSFSLFLSSFLLFLFLSPIHIFSQ
jgi:hypothetical protein